MVQINYSQNRNRFTDLENELMAYQGEGSGEELFGSLGWYVHTVIFKIDNEKGDIVCQQGILLDTV